MGTATGSMKRCWFASIVAGFALRQRRTRESEDGVTTERCDARDLAENDPQLRAREWLAQVQHTQFGTQEIDRFPATFSAAELAPYRAAPGLGEHIFEVYAELLGMPVEDIAAAVGDGLFV